MSSIDVALVQVGYGDDESSADRVIRVCDWIRQLDPVDLIMLPELWAHGGFASSSWAGNSELLSGPTVSHLGRLARELKTWIHAGSVIERARDGAPRGPLGRGLWNTSVLLSPTGEVHATYRKVHRFGFGDGEPQLLEAGEELVVATLDWEGSRSVRAGLATCYDLRFPELFRSLVEQGTEMVLLPAAWPMPRVEHWRLLGQARALENQAWVLQCNTAGSHSGIRMGGNSRIVAPTGEVLAELGEEQAVLTARLDLGLVARVRDGFPVLGDRRL